MAIAVMSQSCDSPTIERQSLCLSGSTPGIAIHAGEQGFKANLDKYFPKAENNMAERLVDFKAELRTLDSDSFWNRLMEGLADLCHAQFAFVSKRILVDDHSSAVEMPLIGEAGSCLMGVALYWNDGKEHKDLARDYKYYAWGAPCSYMRHDKVFLCPEGLASLVPDNPNQLPFQCDAYLGVPLFADGKCFAHFGMMWTKEGLVQKSGLSWSYLEMVMHSLEDMITERLLSGKGFAKVSLSKKSAESNEVQPQFSNSRVIPQEAITAAQSLRPYARSLSHELRTPMQGVVGMLDVMHATVQDQIEGMSNEKIRSVFQALRENIEVVQDSSKRAVEAADNVVHAYDMNMQVPETPSMDAGLSTNHHAYFDSTPRMAEPTIVNPSKRKRNEDNGWKFGNPTKQLQIETRHEHALPGTPRSPMTRDDFIYSSPVNERSRAGTPGDDFHLSDGSRPTILTPGDADILSSPGSRQSNIRDLLPVIVHDSLRVGGRPDSAISETTVLGEKIEVRTRSSNGHASQKIVEWSVDPEVPDHVTMDEKDVTKLISAVFLNAIKFTENGSITLHAKLSSSKRCLQINISDTGTGIPEDFRPELFKPFAKEDHSLTRSKEGLGLGLLVAKGMARRTGGDLVLIRSSTEGPDQGTEFEIRIPLDGNERSSRSNTPFAQTPEAGIPRSTPKASTMFQTPRRPLESMHSPAPANKGDEKFEAPVTGQMNAPEIKERIPLPRRLSSTPIKPRAPGPIHDKHLAEKYPLRFLVAEDNKINRKLLVSMLHKFGYKHVYEAFDGREAVRVVDSLLAESRSGKRRSTTPIIDVVLMDLWMPEMDGYEATEKILSKYSNSEAYGPAPVILAVSADVTEAAVDRATKTGMQGYMTKPFKLMDLQKLIIEFCAPR